MRLEQTRLAIFQGVITITGAIAVYFYATPVAAKSLAYGSSVALIATLFLGWRYQIGTRSEYLGASWILRQAYLTAIVRFLLVIFLLALGFEVMKLAPIWLLMGFMIGQVAWLAAPVWMRLRTQK